MGHFLIFRRRLTLQNAGFSIPEIIQTDAVINPDNSGDPLLNIEKSLE